MIERGKNMDFKDFEKYNNRSKAMLGKNHLVYIENISLMQRKNEVDRYDLRAAMNIYDDDAKLPTKAYVCRIMELADYWGGSSVMLLSSLIMRVIACDCWIVNPEMLNVKGILEKAELLPTYTPIDAIYDERERVLYVKVDNLTVAACGFSELMEENAAYEMLEKALKGLRSYNVISNRIEGRLSDAIEEALASEDLRRYREVGIGAIK